MHSPVHHEAREQPIDPSWKAYRNPNRDAHAVIIHPVHEQGKVWRDGQLVPFADATTHVLSHMAGRGSQVFDVMLVTSTDAGPCAVGLREHVTRFLRSTALMGMEGVGSAAELEQAIAVTVMTNVGPGGASEDHGGSMTVKIIAAWNDESIGVLPATLQPTVYVLTFPSDTDAATGALKAPAKVRSAAMPKIPADILPPSLKVAASYTPGLREQMASKKMGFDQTVFRTVDGDMGESTTLSMLAITGGRVLAPPLDSVLDGITRRVLLDIAQDAQIPVDVRSTYWDEVTGADELLLASTNQPVVPIAQLDEQIFDAPGPVTCALAEGLSRVFDGSHRLSGSWLTPLQGLT